jgi:FkbM family methyltransferase
MTLLEQVVTAFKPHIKGVVHVGAHVANEAAVYDGIADVLWVEANPELIATLQANVHPRGHKTALATLSDEDGKLVTFFVMSGDGGSSSVHMPTKHLELWPDIQLDRCIKTHTKRLDTLLAEKPTEANLLVIDVQGHELAVLKGSGERLRQFDIVIAEAYPQALYEGSTTLGELCAEMIMAGYVPFCSEVNDVLFVKRDHIRIRMPR